MSEISFHQIEQAQQRIAPFIHKTPIVSSTTLNSLLGHNIYFKAECLQKIGAFKARGACNAIAKLFEHGEEPKHIVANSSGNHAQAVAFAARQFNLPATIYMPKNVSKVKAQATAAYGAKVVLCENRDQADELVAEAASNVGTVWVPPYNHQDVISGQGSAAAEALAELSQQQVAIDLVAAPCGGGGLLSGTFIATKALAPGAKVIGAEPLAANDAANSLRTGKIQRLQSTPKTLADGAMTPSLGELTFHYIKQLDGLYEISEPEIVYWSQWLQHLLKLHIEATSAMTMAAVCQWLKDKPLPQNVLVILSGGNIDAQTMAKIWQQDRLCSLPTLG
jgi:threonine dehydratase